MATNYEVEKTGGFDEKDAVRGHSTISLKEEAMEHAYDGENQEHEEKFWDSVKAHPMACIWAFIFCFTIVMESFDMFLNGNFVALKPFQAKYGVPNPTGDGFTIPTKWQSSLFQSGQCGAFIGVFLAGPITNRIGYRWTTILGLILMNATIFISFFADSLEVLVIGQAFEGVPWGLFIANSPAYASEVVPLVLRGATTATLQMSWSIGSIIVAGVCYGFNQRNDEWAWRIPLGLQWIFPTPLLILVFFAPESPWWLVRKGRDQEAIRSLQRLGKKNANPEDKLAVIKRTVEIEKLHGGDPKLLDLLKGTDLRRTIITCLIYASQNFAGNLIANQATYFFEQAGIRTDFAFKLNLINSCLQFVANIVSWPITNWFGRRTIYLWGLATNFTFLIILGICASIKQNSSTNYAQAVLGIIISFVYAGTQGPISYAIIAETSSVRLRALSTGVGRAAYYVAEIPMIYLASRMLNTTGWNLAGKCGYVWGGTAAVCWILAYFGLPELKGRSYRESDILFGRRTPARKFKSTVIDIKENE